MSWCAVAPFSAARVAPALRRPWADRPGSPASLQRPRNQFVNPAGVKGLPCSVTKNERSPVWLTSMMDSRTGNIGRSSVNGARLRPLYCLKTSTPWRTCWRPSDTTSDRRTPVNIRSASASRALLPIGWRFSKRSISSGVQVGKPPTRFGFSNGTSRAGLTVTPGMPLSNAHAKIRRKRFTRLLAASGLSALRSRNMRTAVALKRSIGQSPNSSSAPGAIGSRNIFAKMSRVTCWVRGSSCLNATDPKYSVASQRNVPFAGASRGSDLKAPTSLRFSQS